MTAWIRMIEDEEASEALLHALDRARTPSGTVDNVMRVHSLRPHTLIGHHTLYMSVLHNEGNVLPDWFLETVASYTSLLNQCDYSLSNHWSNASHLIGDPERSATIRRALADNKLEAAFSGKELALLRYTHKLTVNPGQMKASDVETCRDAGADDGEILEVNQVCGYFSYVNRLLNGLGVTLQGDTIGYYPDNENASAESSRNSS